MKGCFLAGLFPSDSSDSRSFYQEIPSSWGLPLPFTQVGEAGQRESHRGFMTESGSGWYSSYTHIPLTRFQSHGQTQLQGSLGNVLFPGQEQAKLVSIQLVSDRHLFKPPSRNSFQALAFLYLMWTKPTSSNVMLGTKVKLSLTCTEEKGA